MMKGRVMYKPGIETCVIDCRQAHRLTSDEEVVVYRADEDPAADIQAILDALPQGVDVRLWRVGDTCYVRVDACGLCDKREAAAASGVAAFAALREKLSPEPKPCPHEIAKWKVICASGDSLTPGVEMEGWWVSLSPSGDSYLGGAGKDCCLCGEPLPAKPEACPHKQAEWRKATAQGRPEGWWVSQSSGIDRCLGGAGEDCGACGEPLPPKPDNRMTIEECDEECQRCLPSNKGIMCRNEDSAETPAWRVFSRYSLTGAYSAMYVERHSTSELAWQAAVRAVREETSDGQRD